MLRAPVFPTLVHQLRNQSFTCLCDFLRRHHPKISPRQVKNFLSTTPQRDERTLQSCDVGCLVIIKRRHNFRLVIQTCSITVWLSSTTLCTTLCPGTFKL